MGKNLNNFIVSLGRKIIPESRFKSYLGKKFQKQLVSYWKTIDSPTPQCSPKYMKLILQLLEKVLAKNIKGDVIECGVGWGGSSFEIAKVLKGKSKYKKLYALDVFESLPPHDIYDSAPDFLLKKRFGDNEIPTYANKQLNYEIDLEKIKRWFLNDDLTNTIFLKRKFIDSFKILNEKRFCFAHVDAGNYLSIKQSAEFLKNRIEPGGITLFDDYNRERFKGLNNAITDLFDEGSLKFITPHGAYWIAP